MKHPYEVSIIMPAYNAANYIAESIISAQEQTFKDWELIVIDDGSTDSTYSVVKQFQKDDGRIKYFHQSNKRLGAARNAGFSLAKGKYIAFLDSDDLWSPEKLEQQLKVIKEKDVDLVFTDGYILKEETKTLEPYPTIAGFYSGNDMYRLEYHTNYIPVLSVLMKSEWVKKVGLQGENVEIFGCEDWDYWLRMARAGASFYGMHEKLFKYRVHGSGMSRNIAVMKLAEFTALHNNIDYRYICKEDVYSRLSGLMEANVPRLLLISRFEHAAQEIYKVQNLGFRFRYFFSHFLISKKILRSHRLAKILLSPKFVLKYLFSKIMI